MSGVCSKHQEHVEGCEMCEMEVWELLGVSKEAFDQQVAYAELEGQIACPYCGFSQYVTTTRYVHPEHGHGFMCMLCTRFYRDHRTEAIN
jgi:hypothetical protein